MHHPFPKFFPRTCWNLRGEVILAGLQGPKSLRLIHPCGCFQTFWYHQIIHSSEFSIINHPFVGTPIFGTDGGTMVNGKFRPPCKERVLRARKCSFLLWQLSTSSTCYISTRAGCPLSSIHAKYRMLCTLISFASIVDTNIQDRSHKYAVLVYKRKAAYTLHQWRCCRFRRCPTFATGRPDTDEIPLDLLPSLPKALMKLGGCTRNREYSSVFRWSCHIFLFL